MKVALDVGSILGTRTGIGHYSASLLEGLLDEDVEILPYAFTSKSGDEGLPTGLRERLIRIPVPGRVVVTAWSGLGWPAADDLLGGADVVHGTNFWIPPLGRRNGVVTIMDLTFWLYPELCTAQVRRYKWIVPKALRDASMVIAPSATIAEEVSAELDFPAERVAVTPLGVRNVFAGAHPDPALLKRLGVDGPYILFAGTQEPRKNLDRLIEAMPECPDDLSLVIAGPPGWGSVDLPAVAHKLKLDHRVRFSGYLTDDQLSALMAGARAFVFPSIYEGFGLPPLEAMAAGIPVVAAATGSLPEVLDDAPFWCQHDDPSSIARAITTAVQDEQARGSAVTRGHEVAARYDWAETVRLTVQVYRRVAEQT